MTNKSGRIGREAENGVAQYLGANGFPQAEPRVLYGINDRADIAGTPGIVWQVKAGQQAYDAGDDRIAQWLLDTQIQRANANADFGVLVLKRKGYSNMRAGKWFAYVDILTALELLGNDQEETDQQRRIVDKWPALFKQPVRFLFQDVVTLLRLKGYGEAL